MATQVKPKTSGSFTTITTTTTGLTAKSSTGLPSTATPGLLHGALRACNEWHNQPGNTTTTARAAKLASAAGVSLQEV